MTSGFSLDTNSVWLPLQSFFLLTVNLDPNDWLSEYANSLKQQAFCKYVHTNEWKLIQTVYKQHWTTTAEVSASVHCKHKYDASVLD